MPNKPYTDIYDYEYFCLTDENTLLCNRDGNLLQITPSEFQDGDKLLSLDKNNTHIWTDATRTTRTVKSGDKIVQLITQRGTFYTTTGHKFFLNSDELAAAGNLQKEQRLKYCRNLTLPSNKSIGISLAYILGSYSAEGHSLEGLGSNRTGKWRIVWNLDFNEEIFAIKILTHLTSAFPWAKAQIDGFEEYTRRLVASYSKELVEKFKSLGALGLCNEKRVPPCIFTSTQEEKAAYLAGLIEGDGTWNKNRINLKLTSKFLIDGAHLLLEDLGIRNSLTYQPATEEDNENYIVSIYDKENFARLLLFCSRFWYGWKHLKSIQEYSGSSHGNTKYCEKDIEVALKKLYPTSLKKFTKATKIPQAAIQRIYGSWNQCLKSLGYATNGSRWANSHKPDNRFIRNNLIHNGTDKEKNQILKVNFLTLEKDILVYDFTVPETSNFLLNTICSHNSGSQMFVFIGDTWVDEITSLQYTTQQNKTPIYGYASQLWDDCAAGQVVVQGSFSINFKEQGYLWAVLRRYKNIMGTEVGFSSRGDKKLLRVDKGRRRDMPTLTNNAGVRVGSNGTAIDRRSIERIVQGNATKGEQYEFYHHLAGYSTFRTNSPKDKTFEDIVEVFEDQVWEPDQNNVDLNSQIRRTDDNAFDNFDIFVVFGNMANPRANHTVQKITDVRLTSQGKQVVVDGKPVQEIYTFLARSVV